MTRQPYRPNLGVALFFILAFVLGSYFTFAAVQGDYGLFRRVQIQAEADTLEVEKARLEAELAELSNLTARLSDHALDLDLLDEQARDVLGFLRADEVVIH